MNSLEYVLPAEVTTAWKTYGSESRPLATVATVQPPSWQPNALTPVIDQVSPAAWVGAAPTHRRLLTSGISNSQDFLIMNPPRVVDVTADARGINGMPSGWTRRMRGGAREVHGLFLHESRRVTPTLKLPRAGHQAIACVDP